jgi:c-di-GMP-binding flagellar brake protein YcgR
VFDASVLDRLVGWSGKIQPKNRAQSQRIIRAKDLIGAIEVIVVGHENGVMKVESDASQILQFEGHAVVIEFRTETELIRLEGSLAIHGSTPPFVATLHPIAMPDQLQRRQWARVPTNVAVRVAAADDPAEAETWHTTTTRDLSPGGACVVTVGALRAGQRVRLDLRLASGNVNVIGDILDIAADGTARIRFVNVSEPDVQRVLRHHMDLQAAQQYPYATS